MRTLPKGWQLLIATLLLVLWILPAGAADEKPELGGVLRVALAGDPPSLDMHQETTFKVMIPMGTCYNTLVRFNPHNYPEIDGDLAKSWTSSEDGLVWTFTLHEGVKFHDGTVMTSADVKASWDKILNPPKGTVSARRSYYRMVDVIETPDDHTVVFKLSYPAASFLPMIALPYNFIYSKKMLDQDMNWHKKNVNGTGPFKFKAWRRGSVLEVEKNPNYFKEGMPYMDGVKYFMIKDLSARAKSVRSGRTDVEFRGFPPAEVDAMKKQMGDNLVVRYPRINLGWGVAFNTTQKPFDDERVRKALSLAIDRYDMAKTLDPLSGLNIVGGPFHPDTPFSLSEEELQQLPGWNKNHAANVAEAKKLLAEAGYPDGFKAVIQNRSVKLPYIDFGVYLVSSWKKIGVDMEHKLEESATWSKNRRNSNFAISVDPYGGVGTGDPDLMLQKFITGGSNNYGKISDPKIDEFFEMQRKELDPDKRAKIIQDFQKYALGKMYWMPGLWWTRIETRSAKIKNYEPLHYHHMNRRLEDVWLAKQ